MTVVAAVCACLAAMAGCGDDAICGPGDAPADGVTASIGGDIITYGNFTSSPNNDCTPPGRTLTSLTLDGKQATPTPIMPLGITLCLPRPDDIGSAPINLGDPDTLQLIDVFVELVDGCLLQLDRGAAVSGSATFEGFCDNGSHGSGYAISFDASIPVTRLCDGTADTLVLSGRAPVQAL